MKKFSVMLQNCMGIEEVYLEDIDINNRTFYVRLGESLTTYSSGARMAVGIAINDILEHNPEWVVFIKNSKTLIDLKQSRILAQG